jgi:hypothetical protein
MACPRRQRRSGALIPGYRSVSRSLAVFSTTAQRSPSPAWSSASSAASRRPQCCNGPMRRRPGTTAGAAGVDWTGARAARRRARGGLTPSAALRVNQAPQTWTRHSTTTRSPSHLTNSCRHPADRFSGPPSSTATGRTSAISPSARYRFSATLLGHSGFAPGTALPAPKQSFVTAPRIGWVGWQAATAPRVRYLGGLENFVPVVRHIS